MLLEAPLAFLNDEIFRVLAERGFGDVRPAHSKIFETVSGEGSRITDMADRALLTKQSMQYLVDDLERLGYAERIVDPSDRRAKLVRLTPRGREVVLIAREAIARTEACWTAMLGHDEIGALRQVLERLRDRLRDS